MRVDNINKSQTNFGIGRVGITSSIPKFKEFVSANEAEIKAIGHPEPICEIFDREGLQEIGRVCIAVLAKGINGSTISGWAEGIAKDKEALLKLVEEANNKMNQEFFNVNYERITAKPEFDSAGRPKLSVVR